MKVYKVVKNIDNVLVSALVTGHHQKVYAKDDKFFNIQNALCFSEKLLSYDFFYINFYGTVELWEAEADNFIFIEKVISLEILDLYDEKQSLDFLRDGVGVTIRYFANFAPVGTILCDNVVLTKKLLSKEEQ